jgi:hypothetical protein
MTNNKFIKFFLNNIGIFLLILILAIGYLLTKLNQRNNLIKIRNSHVFVTGYIGNFQKAGFRQSDYFEFHYKFNGILFKKSDLSKVYLNDFKNYFINKKFPVILNPSNPEDGEMLIFRPEFKKYGYEQPDSLIWVNELQKKEIF